MRQRNGQMKEADGSEDTEQQTRLACRRTSAASSGPTAESAEEGGVGMIAGIRGVAPKHELEPPLRRGSGGAPAATAAAEEERRASFWRLTQMKHRQHMSSRKPTTEQTMTAMNCGGEKEMETGFQKSCSGYAQGST